MYYSLGGINDAGFFHKDAGENAPDFIKSFAVYSESSKKEIEYIICNDKATLSYLNNLGCIELNPWHSTIIFPDKPDYMIVDIDPSEKIILYRLLKQLMHLKKVYTRPVQKVFVKLLALQVCIFMCL